jgi:hypothetical protein
MILPAFLLSFFLYHKDDELGFILINMIHTYKIGKEKKEKEKEKAYPNLL